MNERILPWTGENPAFENPFAADPLSATRHAVRRQRTTGQLLSLPYYLVRIRDRLINHGQVSCRWRALSLATDGQRRVAMATGDESARSCPTSK